MANQANSSSSTNNASDAKVKDKKPKLHKYGKSTAFAGGALVGVFVGFLVCKSVCKGC